MTGAVLQNDDQGIVVNVSLGIKKRGGRKEVILTEAFASDDLRCGRLTKSAHNGDCPGAQVAEAL